MLNINSTLKLTHIFSICLISIFFILSGYSTADDQEWLRISDQGKIYKLHVVTNQNIADLSQRYLEMVVDDANIRYIYILDNDNSLIDPDKAFDYLIYGQSAMKFATAYYLDPEDTNIYLDQEDFIYEPGTNFLQPYYVNAPRHIGFALRKGYIYEVGMPQSVLGINYFDHRVNMYRDVFLETILNSRRHESYVDNNTDKLLGFIASTLGEGSLIFSIMYKGGDIPIDDIAKLVSDSDKLAQLAQGAGKLKETLLKMSSNISTLCSTLGAVYEIANTKFIIDNDAAKFLLYQTLADALAQQRKEALQAFIDEYRDQDILDPAIDPAMIAGFDAAVEEFNKYRDVYNNTDGKGDILVAYNQAIYNNHIQLAKLSIQIVNIVVSVVCPPCGAIIGAALLGWDIFNYLFDEWRILDVQRLTLAATIQYKLFDTGYLHQLKDDIYDSNPKDLKTIKNALHLFNINCYLSWYAYNLYYEIMQNPIYIPIQNWFSPVKHAQLLSRLNYHLYSCKNAYYRTVPKYFLTWCSQNGDNKYSYGAFGEYDWLEKKLKTNSITINAQCNKTNFLLSDQLTLSVNINDQNGNPISDADTVEYVVKRIEGSDYTLVKDKTTCQPKGNGLYQDTFTVSQLGNMGSYVIEVTAKKEGYIDGTSSASFNVTIPALGHNLKMVSFNTTHGGTFFYPGERVNFDITIDNIGNYTESYSLTVTVTGPAYNPPPWQVSSGSIAPHSPKSFSTHWDIPSNATDGTYIAEAKVIRTDGENDIGDEDDSDNKLSIPLDVGNIPSNIPKKTWKFNVVDLGETWVGEWQVSNNLTYRIEVTGYNPGTNEIFMNVYKNGQILSPPPRTYTSLSYYYDYDINGNPNLMIFNIQDYYNPNMCWYVHMAVPESHPDLYLDPVTKETYIGQSVEYIVHVPGNTDYYYMEIHECNPNDQPNIFKDRIWNWFTKTSSSIGYFTLRATPTAIPANSTFAITLDAGSYGRYVLFGRILVADYYDIKLNSINTTPSSPRSGDIVTITNNISNVGSGNLTNIEVSSHISGPNGYAKSSNTTSNAGNVNFVWDTIGLANGTYNITTTIFHPNDMNNSNNSMSTSVTLGVPYTLVVSANSNKSTYCLGEEATVSITVTNDTGGSVSDAAVTYSVFNSNDLLLFSGQADPLGGCSYSASFNVPANPGIYKIKVRADSLRFIGNETAYIPFQVTDCQSPSVTLLSPNGGEVWSVGSTYNINWSATDNLGVTDIKIEYSTDGGTNYSPIISSTDNDGVHQWLIQEPLSDTCRVKIIAYDAANNSGVDINDANFEISQPPDIAVSDSSLDFESISIGSYADRSFTIENLGAGKLTIFSTFIDNKDFLLIEPETFPVEIDPGDPDNTAVTFTVRFAPSSGGTKEGILGINNDDPDEADIVIDLTGGTIGGLATVFQEDFESYEAGSFPSAGDWIALLNAANDTANNAIVTTAFVSSSKSMQLYGSHTECLLAQMNHEIPKSLTTFMVEAYIIASGEGQSPCYSYDISLGLEPTLGTGGVELIRLSGDESLNGANGQLQSYSFGEWYKIKAFIDSPNNEVHYWINDTYKGSQTVSLASSYKYIYVNSGDGKGWIDDIKIYAPVIYVDASNTTGIEFGSQEHPFNTIQEGIDAAMSGTTIEVANGIYQENIILKNGIHLLGMDAVNTIIDGGGSGVVIEGAHNCKIEKFTIKGSGDSSEMDLTIAGIKLVDCDSVVIQHNIIKDNGMQGIWINHQSADIDILHNIIQSNYDYGISTYASPRITNNLIIQNGRGIGCHGSSVAEIINNTISFNSRMNGIECNQDSAPIIKNNIITDNAGSGINCSINNNPGLITIGYNNIWNNLENYLGIGDQTGINGNISEEPQFINPNQGDYHLQISSPCIDTGDQASDYSNEPEPNGSRINLGAYGNTSEAAKTLPKIVISKNELDFGNVLMGAFFDQSLTVENIGRAELTITNISINGDADFTLVNPPTLPLNINQSNPPTTITVRFTPSINTLREANLIINCNDPDSSENTIPLSGQGFYLTANFSAQPLSGGAPLTVQFTDQSIGASISNWLWNFDDGTSSTAQNPVHIYENGGSYTVTLTVTGGGEIDDEIKPNYINVDEWPAGTTWYVDCSVSESGDGTSWAAAFKTIGEGINKASRGNIIMVADGIYNENIIMKSGLNIQSQSGAEETIINGENSLPVVIGADEATIDGFTVTNGACGILCEDTTSIIKNCIIIENIDRGIRCHNSSSLCNISNNIITSNQGGGISLNNSFGTVENNLIESNGNLDETKGGGIFTLFDSLGESNLILRNNKISNNKALDGGGVYIQEVGDEVPPVEMYNNLITYNTALNSGGAVFWQAKGSLVNNTIFGNSASHAGGIYIFQNPCGNTKISNNIIWNNGDDYDEYSGCDISFSYNNVEDGDYEGINSNISSDPLFRDPANNNFKLQLLSPSVDVGTEDGAPEVDIDGNSRPLDGNDDGVAIIDMGAYEFVLGPPFECDFSDTDISKWARKGRGVAQVINGQLMLKKTSKDFCLFPRGALAGNSTIEVKINREGGNRGNVSSSIFFSYQDKKNFWELKMELPSIRSKKPGKWILLHMKDGMYVEQHIIADNIVRNEQYLVHIKVGEEQLIVRVDNDEKIKINLRGDKPTWGRIALGSIGRGNSFFDDLKIY